MAEESKYVYDEESVKAIIEWAQTAQLPQKVMLSEAEHIFDTSLYVNANICDIKQHYSDAFYNPAIDRLCRQYFREHPECRAINDFSFGGRKVEQKPKQVSQPSAIGYIPPHYVEKSKSVHSNFFRFISSLLTSYYGSKAKEVLKRLLEGYRLGATRDGAVIFWQIDSNNKVRTGKVIQYNPEDGHRIKGGQTSAVNWIHSILKKQQVLPQEWQLSQYLFGEHLLGGNPGKVAVLVESEKSAVIGSAIFPGYVWLATGGKSQLREEKLRVLTGRTVLLFPDADGYAEWKQRAGSMNFCKAIVSDIIEKNATPKQKADHIDIADWIICQIREGKLMCTADHLVEAEKILQRMMEKNPLLQKTDRRFRPCIGRCNSNRQR